MPELTNVEETFLIGLETKADSLKNGHKGDIEVLSEVVADIAHVLAAMARTGAVSLKECQHFRNQYTDAKSDGGWKTALAISVPICVAACSVIIPVVLKLVE